MFSLRFSGGTKMPFSFDQTVSPPIAISPESGVSNPTIHLSRVVFPHPLGPKRVKICLAGIVRSTSTRALILLPSEKYSLFKPLMLIPIYKYRRGPETRNTRSQDREEVGINERETPLRCSEDLLEFVSPITDFLIRQRPNGQNRCFVDAIYGRINIGTENILTHLIRQHLHGISGQPVIHE